MNSAYQILTIRGKSSKCVAERIVGIGEGQHNSSNWQISKLSAERGFATVKCIRKVHIFTMEEKNKRWIN